MHQLYMNVQINDTEKYKLIKNKFSNPKEVFKKLQRLYNIDSNLEFNISTRKNKKYMVKGDFTNNKYVHFGEMGYEDYTFHKDKTRQINFLKIDIPKYNKICSYYILYGQ